MQNSKNPRTDEFISTLIIGTIDRNNGRIAWGTKDIETLVSHARELERELTQARVFLEVSTQNTEAAQNSFHAEMKRRGSAEAERDQLRKELAESRSWVKPSMESAAIAASTIAGLETERDQLRKELSNKTGYAHLVAEIGQLRKMLDAFAELVGHGDEWLMADYRDLPHVRSKGKTK